MTNLEQVPCAGCGSVASDRWLEAGDVEFGGEDRFSLVRCRDCGLTYLNPRPTAAAIGAFYPRGYYTHSPMSDEAAEKAYADALALVDRFAKQGALLDIGAGDGAFLARLAARGRADLTGLEPDGAAQRVAAEERGLAVLRGAFPSAGLREQSFATITMLEAIEHLHHPDRAFREVRDLLEPGGRFLLTTPNVGGLEPRLLKGRSVSLQVPRHLYFFDPHTLAAMLRRAGLMPLMVRTGGSLQGLTRSLWLLARSRQRPGAGVMDVQYHPTSWRRRAHELVTLGMAPAAWAAARGGLGASLQAVAERPEHE